MSELAGLPERCPACGAAVRSSVDWCTQCYAPLRPTTDEREEPDGSADRTVQADGGDAPGVGGCDVSGAQAGPVAGTDADGEGGDGTADVAEAATAGSPLARREAERVADQLLAQLAAEPDPVRSWAAKVDSAPGGKVGAIVILAVAATVVLLVVMYIVGSLG